MLFLDFAFFILEQNIRGFDTLLLSGLEPLALFQLQFTIVFLSERLELQILSRSAGFARDTMLLELARFFA